MTSSPQSPRILSIAVAGAALGAAAMYVFDPNKGRRRRALFRDKARRSLSSFEDHLVIFDRPESIPSLQGGRSRDNRPANRRGERNRFWRNAAVVAGGALAITALTRNSYSGSAKIGKR